MEWRGGLEGGGGGHPRSLILAKLLHVLQWLVGCDAWKYIYSIQRCIWCVCVCAWYGRLFVLLYTWIPTVLSYSRESNSNWGGAGCFWLALSIYIYTLVMRADVCTCMHVYTHTKQLDTHHMHTHACTCTRTHTHTHSHRGTIIHKHSDYTKLNLHSLEAWDG